MYTQIAFDSSITEYSLDLADYLKNQTFSTGSAYLIIDNQCTDSGVQLQKGGVIQRTEEGIATINSGYNRKFRIDMAKIGDRYDTTASIEAYSIGTQADLKSVARDLYGESGAIISAPPVLTVDKIYKIKVTGSVNAGTLKIIWLNSNSAPQAVDLTDFQ